jgi:hypothetical protein
MMTARQTNFRQVYRSRIAGWYNGPVHVVVIYTIGFTALWIYAQFINDPTWLEWSIIPATFLMCNIFEWFLHKYVMHRPHNNPGLRAIYERHTLNHHQFFTDQEMRFRDHKDWRVTFFPPYALVVFILMSSVGVLVLNMIATQNAAWLFISATTSMYLIYEFMHFCCHVDENAFVRWCPLVNTLRRHHTAHHNDKIMMERNMNLTFPIADWLFGTSDLDRGLLGHLFNGYNTDHLKKDLRAIPLRPDEAAASPMPAE